MLKRLVRILIPASFVVLAACAPKGENGRWYTQAQVDAGKEVFQSNCASCHGRKAQGRVMNWKKPDKNGNYPPPPLNGTAHAWHHSMKVLKHQIKKGGIPNGGVMPGFENSLSDEQIKNAIAYFQSFWSDEIYQAWLERGGLN